MQGSWDVLSVELHRSITSVLWLEEDKDSLHALMQTCRGMRLLISSFVTKLEVTDMLALRRFPR